MCNQYENGTQGGECHKQGAIGNDLRHHNPEINLIFGVAKSYPVRHYLWGKGAIVVGKKFGIGLIC